MKRLFILLLLLPMMAMAQQITLHWTAPGDDDHTGTAAEYDVRYSPAPITKENWDEAIQVDGEPKPQSAGETESMAIELTEGTYYFALKTADEVPNWSAMSNVAKANVGYEGRWGDLNGDGIVNPVDVVLLVNCVYKNQGCRD